MARSITAKSYPTRVDGKVTGYKVRWRDPDNQDDAYSCSFRGVGAKARGDQAVADLKAHGVSDLLDPRRHSKFMPGTTTRADRRWTVGDWCSDWAARQPHSPRTVVQVAHVMTRLVAHLGPDTDIDAVRPSHLQALVKAMRGGRRPLSPVTIKARLVWVRAVFAAALADGIIPADPAAGLKGPDVHDRDYPEPPPWAQLVAMAETLPAWWRRAPLIGALTGLRPGELFGLTAGQIRVPDVGRAYVMVDRQHDGETLKTRRSKRRVPLSARAMQLISDQLTDYPPGPGGHLFRSQTGERMTNNGTRTTWRKACSRHGLPDGYRLHDLRHWFASYLISGGTPTLDVAQYLGDSLAMVEKTYGHLVRGGDDRACDVLDAVAAETLPARRLRVVGS